MRSATQTMDGLLETLQDRQLQIKLKEVQKAAGKGEGKLPIKPVDTRCFERERFDIPCFLPPRWSTKIYAMKVLLSLKDYINLVVPNPPGTSDWTLMEKCVERLLPIANATEGVESDGATLETVTRYVSCPRTPVVTKKFSFFQSFIGLEKKPHPPCRHIEILRGHWSNQTDFSTFNTPALQSLGTPTFLERVAVTLVEKGWCWGGPQTATKDVSFAYEAAVRCCPQLFTLIPSLQKKKLGARSRGAASISPARLTSLPALFTPRRICRRGTRLTATKLVPL